MNKLLAATFVALLMVGCGEIGNLLAPEVQMIPPLSEEQEKIIAEAIRIEFRSEKGEKLAYALNEQTPYTGWSKSMYGNGQISALTEWKDGEVHGLELAWYTPNEKKNGKYVCIMKSAKTWQDGKQMSAAIWKLNGDKCPVTNLVNGNGVVVYYRDDGTERDRATFKDGEPVR